MPLTRSLSGGPILIYIFAATVGQGFTAPSPARKGQSREVGLCEPSGPHEIGKANCCREQKWLHSKWLPPRRPR